MKKRDLYLAAAVLLSAGILWAVTGLLQKKEGSTLSIFVNNELYGTYSLWEEQEIAVGDTNICIIQNGEVRMISADCPDQICVHSNSISQKGETIICMPNRVVLEITEGKIGGMDILAK